MRFRLAIALLLALIAVIAAARFVPGSRVFAVFDTNPPTPYFHYNPIGPPRGRLLLVHGLNSSKNVMSVLSYGLADAGFEVFAIDLPGHGDSPAPFDALRAQAVIEAVLEKLGPDTSVIGHSLGGALLLDVTNDRPVKKMVLFSPAPTPLDEVRAERVLVLEGQFDPRRIHDFAPEIGNSTTGSFETRELAWTGHSGGQFKPTVIADVARWLGGNDAPNHTSVRLMLIVLKIVLSVA